MPPVRPPVRKPLAGSAAPDLVSRISDLIDQGKTADEIRSLLATELAVEPIAAGIIRTRKGALMVRVSDDRWPIAMYRKDWEILLGKVPAIREALDTLDIAEENPLPSRKIQDLQQQEREAAEKGVA